MREKKKAIEEQKQIAKRQLDIERKQKEKRILELKEHHTSREKELELIKNKLEKRISELSGKRKNILLRFLKGKQDFSSLEREKERLDDTIKRMEKNKKNLMREVEIKNKKLVSKITGEKENKLRGLEEIKERK